MYKIITFPVHGDKSGNLIALEKGRDFPFDIKRVYYIWGTQHDIVRGKHGHRSLQQVIICTSGSCDFTLDDGNQRVTVHLDKPTEGLYISSAIWREFTNFSPDCVIMVLADRYYCKEDYITSYEEFIHELTVRKQEEDSITKEDFFLPCTS